MRMTKQRKEIVEQMKAGAYMVVSYSEDSKFSYSLENATKLFSEDVLSRAYTAFYQADVLKVYEDVLFKGMSQSFGWKGK